MVRVSDDAVVGSDQEGEMFYRSIEEFYEFYVINTVRRKTTSISNGALKRN